MDFSFNSVKIKDQLATYVKILSHHPPSNPFEKTRDNYSSFIMQSMVMNAELWDKRTPFNKKYISTHLINRVNEADMSDSSLDDMYSILLRFFIEYYINTPDDLSGEYQAIRDFSKENLSSFSDIAANQVDFALHDMSTSIIRDVMNSEDLTSIKKYDSLVESSKALQEKWELDLKAREDRVNQLQETLINQKNAFNFVNLHRGFESLGSMKEKQLKWGRFFLIALGIMIPVMTPNY